MKSALLGLFLIALLASFLLAEPTKTKEEAIDEALAYLKMTRGDLTFHITGANQDSFRLSIVNYLMNHIDETADTVLSFGKQLNENSPFEGAMQLYSLFGYHLEKPVIKSSGESYPWKGHTGIPPRVQEALTILYDSIREANLKVKESLWGIDSSAVETLFTYPEEIIRHQDDLQENVSLEERYRKSREFKSLESRFFDISTEVNKEKLAEAVLLVLWAASYADSALASFNGNSYSYPSGDSIPAEAASGDVIFFAETGIGDVVVGGPGKTYYKKPFAVIIDIGGDDEYSFDTPSSPGKSSVIVDISGNDIYRANSPFSLAGGLLSVSILVDIQGNDTYRTGNFSLGCGILGGGILIDNAGDDIYVGSGFTQGAGCLGVGMLYDFSGNDHFRAGIMAQGFGFTGGAGILSDRVGFDVYEVEPTYRDRSFFDKHYISLSQGFALGVKGKYSGGIGLLIDGGGDDLYRADILAQGGAYYYSLGGLVDLAGNDRYIGFQWCQASANHMTVSSLVDMEGDDGYFSHRFSQGYGNDYAAGYLWDISGNDNYSVWDISQAAGSRRGFGFLVDENGDDSYLLKSSDSSASFGEVEQQLDGIGIFVDIAGDDSFAEGWRKEGVFSSGNMNIGIDFDE
ncbi:hypothetical protein J7K18_03390 [bacterium]|nr:hypothetical protein [bacterium]